MSVLYVLLFKVIFHVNFNKPYLFKFIVYVHKDMSTNHEDKQCTCTTTEKLEEKSSSLLDSTKSNTLIVKLFLKGNFLIVKILGNNINIWLDNEDIQSIISVRNDVSVKRTATFDISKSILSQIAYSSERIKKINIENMRLSVVFPQVK